MENEITNKKSKLVRFYVPMHKQDGEYVSRRAREDFIRTIKKLASKANGGFTCYESTGGYLSSNGELVEEPVMVIETIGKNPVSDMKLIHFSQGLEQECMMVVEAEQVSSLLYRGNGMLIKNGEPDYLKYSAYKNLLAISETCDLCKRK